MSRLGLNVRLIPLLWVIMSGCELVSGLSSLEVVETSSKPDAAVSNVPDAASASASPSTSQSTKPDASTPVSSSELDASHPPDAEPTASVVPPDSGTAPSASGSASSSPDGGTDASACKLPTNGACDPVANCGCAPGEMCAYTASSSISVTTCGTPGNVEPAGACDGAFDCSIGYYCHEGLCARACHSDADCPSAGAACLSEADDTPATSETETAYCTRPCNPLDPENALNSDRTCGTGATCIAVRDEEGHIDHTECVIQTGQGQAGDACLTAAECETGYDCIGEECVAWCRVGQDTCPVNSACNAKVTIGNVSLGQCEAAACSPETGNYCAVLPASCGCDEGEQCQVVYPDGTTACVETGTAGLLEECSGDSDCELGLSCMRAACRPYCEGATCAEGECIEIPWESGEAGGGSYCTGQCDPVNLSLDDEANTPCGSDFHCEPLPADPYLTNTCVLASGYDVPVGGSCEQSRDCTDGAGCVCDGQLGCADNLWVGMCREFCNEDSECGGYFGDCVFDTANVGYCCGDPPTAESQCELGTNCGCNYDERCAEVTSDGITACLTREFGVCQFDFECPYSTCDAPVDGVGLCRPLCDYDETCSIYYGECAIDVPVADGSTANLCQGRCDPVDPTTFDSYFTPCGAGAACMRGGEFSNGSLCVLAIDVKGEGEFCDTDAECHLGLGCNTNLLECAWLCRSDEDCVTGETCDLVDAIGYGSDSTDIVGVCYAN
jgi:hypothetical protein